MNAMFCGSSFLVLLSPHISSYYGQICSVASRLSLTIPTPEMEVCSDGKTNTIKKREQWLSLQTQVTSVSVPVNGVVPLANPGEARKPNLKVECEPLLHQPMVMLKTIELFLGKHCEY